MTITQKERLLEYLEIYGSITPLEALSHLGIMRLAARISELRKAGYKIKSERVTNENRYGRIINYTRYRLVKEE